MTGQRPPTNSPLHYKPRDCELREQASWAPSLLLSAPAPLPNKVSCSLRTCVSADKSSPGVRQAPASPPRPPQAWPSLTLAPGWEAGTSDGAPEPCGAAAAPSWWPLQTRKAPRCRLSWWQWLQSSAMTLWVQGQRSLRKNHGAGWGAP